MSPVPQYGGLFYLQLEEALAAYSIALGCSVQEAEDQLRNRSGLDSALMRPLMYAHYYQADIALQTVVLVHGIAEGQHFIDGNKRTAYLAGIAFLDENGYALDLGSAEIAHWTEALSEDLDEDALAARFRDVLNRV